MAKILGPKRRSGWSLIASGAASINIDQALRVRRMPTTREALQGDWDRLSNDGRRAISRVGRDLEQA